MTRRSLLPLLGLSLCAIASCSDSTRPVRSESAPSEHYQLTATGTLDAEIGALINALFPTGLETAAGTRWDLVRNYVAAGDLVTAKARLLDLVKWIRAKQPQMDPPPNGETRDGAVARLVLYMALYVYQGPATPPPPEFTTGADAITSIVSPDSQAVIQTPLKHAGARFDAGTVSGNTIVVISQNALTYAAHCDGPFSTKYCQYPLYYHYQSFPVQRFLKPVHLAICHVPTGGSYGPLAGVDHEKFVVAHDKPASSANYTEGGYPVPGEGIEILPGGIAPPTTPLIACSGTTYPQVSLVEYAPTRHDLGGVLLAAAARGVNRALGAVAGVLTPRSAYAIDNGAETLSSFFSTFTNIDTLGHPDLALSSVSTPASVVAGQSITLSYTVANNGTAPSPAVNTTITIVANALTYLPTPITLTPTAVTGATGTLYPLQSRTQTATVIIPSSLAGGNYTLGVSVASAGGVAELATATTDNAFSAPVTVGGAAGRYATSGVDGVWSPGEWDESRCSSLTVLLPGGNTAPGTLCYQNSATDVYFGLRIFTSRNDGAISFGVTFDNDASGTTSSGDDAFVANRQTGTVYDSYYTPCAANPAALCSVMDDASGGVANGAAAWGHDATSLILEASHPLNSGDGHDIALTAGQAIGFQVLFRMIDPALPSNANLADTYFPSSSGFTPLYTYSSTPVILSRVGGTADLSVFRTQVAGAARGRSPVRPAGTVGLR